MQVEKSGFFQPLPPCQVPEWVYISQLVSNAEHSCWALSAGTSCIMVAWAKGLSTWLHCASGTWVLSNRQMELSSDFTSAVVNIHKTMRMKLAYMILPAVCTMWLWNILEICSIEIKTVLTTRFRGYRLLILTSFPTPMPSHFVPVCIPIFNQYSGLKLYTGFNQKNPSEYESSLSVLYVKFLGFFLSLYPDNRLSVNVVSPDLNIPITWERMIYSLSLKQDVPNEKLLKEKQTNCSLRAQNLGICGVWERK